MVKYKVSFLAPLPANSRWYYSSSYFEPIHTNSGGAGATNVYMLDYYSHLYYTVPSTHVVVIVVM